MGDNDTDELPVERAVKFTGPNTIEGLAIPFGGIPALKGRDTDAEAFDGNTDLCLNWFPQRPVLYDHGLDKAHGAIKVGDSAEYETREGGVWQQSQLDKNAKYRRFIDELIEKEALGYSTGAYQHLATKNSKGIITRWPWIETSLTPIPANPLALNVHYVKSSALFAAIEAGGQEVPAPLKAALTALDAWAESRDDSPPDGLKFAEHADRLLADVEAFRSRAESLVGLRAKAGRVLSATTRERLMRHPASLRELADDLDGLLSEADAEKAAKSVDLLALSLDYERSLARLSGVELPAEGAPA